MLEKNKISISICITTLNRYRLLDKTLKNLINFINERFEIIIYDAGSLDETFTVVKKHKQKFKNIIYKLATINEGIDKDYFNCSKLARGEYIWFFSDDDYIKKGIAKLLLEKIKKNYSLILVNSEIRDKQCKEVIKPRFLQIDSNKSYSKDDFEDFFIHNAYYLSFIGGVIVNKKFWKSRNRTKYFGTLFAMAGSILNDKILGEIYIISKPYVIIRYGNASWVENSFKISLINWPNVIWSLNSISDSAKLRVSEIYPWKNLFRLMIFRARGAFNIKLYNELFKHSDCSFIRKIAAFIIAFFPGVILNLIFLVYFNTCGKKNLNSKLQILDLKNSKFYIF